MNLTGFSVIHESNLEPGKTYYHKSRFGEGFVLASESHIRGWTVEVQAGASFNTPLGKQVKVGELMTVPPMTGKFYEPES
jgi:hypothetical protein